MMESGRLLHVSQRVYEVLLLAYPREFREEYGKHMAQVFGDWCRKEYGRSGTVAFIGLWVRALIDLSATAITERSKAMRHGLSYLGGRLLTLRTLMLSNAAVILAFGATLANAPYVIELYGFAPPLIGSSNPQDWVGIAFARFFGVTCLAFGLLL